MSVMHIVVSHNKCLFYLLKFCSLKLMFCPFEMDKRIHADNLKNEDDVNT